MVATEVREPVVAAIGLAEQPCDGAQTALDQAEEATVIVRLVGIGVLIDAELRLRLQRHEGTVGEAHLGASVAGIDGVAAGHVGAARQRATAAVGAERAHFTGGEFDPCGIDGQRRQRKCCGQGERQTGGCE
jgi:hypothetical protein